MKYLLSILALVVTMASSAQASVDVRAIASSAQIEALATAGLQWKVGDKADYKLDGGFIQGTVASVVRSDTGSGFWVDQDMDLGFMGKQKVEILFNKADGQILKIIANGQEQQIPDTKDLEVVEMKEANVQVPAGTFDCIYVKILDKKENKYQEAWVNPKAVPISGVLKSIADTQFGKIQQLLTSFKFAN